MGRYVIPERLISNKGWHAYYKSVEDLSRQNHSNINDHGMQLPKPPSKTETNQTPKGLELVMQGKTSTKQVLSSHVFLPAGILLKC